MASEFPSPLETVLVDLEGYLKKIQGNDVNKISDQLSRCDEEFIALIKEFDSVKKEKDKLLKEINKVKEAIDKAESSSLTCQSQTGKLEAKIAKKESIVAEERTKLEAAMDVWQLLGLSIVPLTNGKKSQPSSDPASGDLKHRYEGDYAIEFTRMDPQNPTRKFTVKVSITSKSVKIYETDPKDIFNISDLDRIELKASTPQDGLEGVDFRLLIVLLRQHISSKLTSK